MSHVVILLFLFLRGAWSCDNSFNAQRNGVKFMIEGKEKDVLKTSDYTGKTVTVLCANSHEVYPAMNISLLMEEQHYKVQSLF